MKMTEELRQKIQDTLQRERNLHKTIKVADLENFEVFAYAPCYKQLIVAAPNYFIDLDTNLNMGQEIRLAVFPDGTLEQSHYALYIVSEGKQVVVATEDIPYVEPYNVEG